MVIKQSLFKVCDKRYIVKAIVMSHNGSSLLGIRKKRNRRIEYGPLSVTVFYSLTILLGKVPIH